MSPGLDLPHPHLLCCPKSSWGPLSWDITDEEQGQLSYSYDLRASSPMCLRHWWGSDGIFPPPMLPHDGCVIGTALPCSQLQGWLIYTSAHGVGSSVLPTWGEVQGLFSRVLQLVVDRGSSQDHHSSTHATTWQMRWGQLSHDHHFGAGSLHLCQWGWFYHSTGS